MTLLERIAAAASVQRPIPREEKGRYEIKFVVDEDMAARIKRHIRPYCVIDPHVKPGMDGYTVTSVYLDTSDLRFYWDRRRMQWRRIKVRVRTYGVDHEGPAHLELKRRFGDVLVKTRAMLPEGVWHQVADPAYEFDTGEWGLNEDRERVVEDFRLQCITGALKPLVCIRYERQPFVGLLEERVRVTFDRALRYAPVPMFTTPLDERLFQAFDLPSVFARPRSLMVMEVKFNNRFPLWLADMAGRFDLIREPFSKYCHAVELMLDEQRVHTPRLRASNVV